MTQPDTPIQPSLQAVNARLQPSAPPFQRVWAAAEQRVRRARQRRIAGFTTAGIVVVAVSISLLKPTTETQEFGIDLDALMGSTSWSAPSDSLLPERRFDIYHEVPRLFESTEPANGALL